MRKLVPTWFVGARLVIEGMSVCARSCSRGSSLAGGNRGVLLGLQSTSEDCEMELTWLPVAAGCPRRSQVWPLGFAGQKPLSLGISTCGRSCHGGKAFLIPAGSHPAPPPQGALFQPCLEHCCFLQLWAQGNTDFGLIQHESRSLLIFPFSVGVSGGGRSPQAPH